MLRILLIILLLTWYNKCVKAQIVYRSYNFIGVVAGEAKSAYQVLTTHGIQHRSWYAGIGAGIDDYRNRTVPLFVSIVKQVLPQNNMFVNINAGTQFIWGKNERHTLWNAVDSKAFPGFLGEAGIGYRLPVGKDGQGMMFGTYYSYKSFREKFTVVGICNNPPCENMTEYIDSKFNRWAFKVGFVF
ncbi:MAG: hypothetical protein QM763_19205 [Agriterribacter sp.]